MAVGGGAVVIPEGPEDSKGVRSSAPANTCWKGRRKKQL